VEYKAFNLKSSNGLDLAGHHWEPEGDIKAHILLIHGQSDHARRYDILAERFCNRGYEIWAADLPGHGDSKGKRGHITAYQDYLEVIDLLQDKVSIPGLSRSH
jgi:alpha-beta hydrolase superfamily lysophospholipase